jgi:hypothetical protein
MRAKHAPSEELIWQGRLHLGDQPGVIGDATFVGLAVEFPVTLHAFRPSEPADITFQLETNRVAIYSPSTGHKVSVFAFAEDKTTTPSIWARRFLVEGWMDQEILELKVTNMKGESYLSVRVEVASELMPGLYEDFIVRRLALKSTTHYADFGFCAA